MDMTRTEGKPRSKLLVCEDYPAMHNAFRLILGRQYELIFAHTPEEIVPLLGQHSVRLLIWNLDRATGSLETALNAIRTADDPLRTYRESICIDGSLDTLKVIRQTHPKLRILLMAGEFECDFQVAAIQQCGLVSFLTTPWKSNAELVEKVQVLLGDRKSSIRNWVLRMPMVQPKERWGKVIGDKWKA